MTGMVQTDLAHPSTSKYKDEPADDHTSYGVPGDEQELTELDSSYDILGIKVRPTFTFNIQDQQVLCNSKSSPTLLTNPALLYLLDHTPLTLWETEFYTIHIRTDNQHRNRGITRPILHIQQRVHQLNIPQVVSETFVDRPSIAHTYSVISSPELEKGRVTKPGFRY
ncbi:hypothetical protein ETB97_009082 [Aspergillus alliaceus]|uniref:Uncharacterized protein n=1 Tax=Petromyces alliaceus TaxID=209559 RepID=A0A8H5ZUR9_PETAA|nr:hypothetical protein ETB97_009082 [Aspergillus burnettii]